MACIVYGVSGEGSGHSSRSSEVRSQTPAHGDAWQLEQGGYGVAARGDLCDCVAKFIAEIEILRARVARAPRNDGSLLRNKVIELVERFTNQSRPA